MDLPVRNAPPLLSRGSFRAKGARLFARRGQQDAHLPAGEVLPALRVPGRRRRGSAIGGLFDPICIAVRSIGLGVIPAMQYLTHRALGAAQDAHSRPCRRADHTQDFLARRSGSPSSSTSTRRGSSSSLLVAVLFANRFIPRFWCRVLCPLGAFLGVFSRFALFGMEKDHAKCTDCNLCLVTARAPTRRKVASSGARTSATCA
jgi:hypothetical protein